MQSPFKFLDSYTREDREIFFGRDREIEELYHRVFESRIMLVYGVSGTGKSSLIQCGLANKFQETDWLPLMVRRGGSITQSLAASIKSASITPIAGDIITPSQFRKAVRSLYLDHYKPVFFIFDQFEELFIFGEREERRTFISIARALTESDLQCRMIFVMREEYMAGITEFEKFIPTIFSNRVRIEKMSHRNALEAIKEPCKVFGIGLEEGFAEALLERLSPGESDVELTYLQVYLDKIFRLSAGVSSSEGSKEGGSPAFTLSILEKAGNVSDLLGNFLDEQITMLDDQDIGLTVLKSFVSLKGTRRQMASGDISDYTAILGKPVSNSKLLELLQLFVNLRILRDKDQNEKYELRHDALASRIFEHLSLKDKELLDITIFLENALMAYKLRNIYLNRDDIEYISGYEDKLFLTRELKDFISSSRSHLYAQQKALKRLTRIVAAVFIIIIGILIQYYVNRKGSADIRALTTLALILEKTDPLNSIYTALRVHERDSSSTTIQGVLLSSFTKLLFNKFESGDTTLPSELIPISLSASGRVANVKMTRSGDYLYGWTHNNEVFVYNVNESEVRALKVSKEIVFANLSDDGRTIAVVFNDNTGEVYRTTGKILFAFNTTVNHLMNERLVRFFPEGSKYFMAAVKGDNAVIYDSSGFTLFNLSGHKSSINSLDISSDGRFLATVSSDKTGLIWNYNYKTKVFSPYDTLAGHQDTVWSCEFNKKGKWILTSSADSVLKIWNLSGKRYSLSFSFAPNYSHGPLFWWPDDEPRIGKFNIYHEGLDLYYNKICNAEFCAEERAIIATNYNYTKLKDLTNNKTNVTKVLYFGWSVIKKSNPYLSDAESNSDSIFYRPIRHLSVNNSRTRFATIRLPDNEITISADDGYKLLTLQGEFPLFTTDDRWLLLLNKGFVLRIPIDEQIIKHYVLDKMIFGQPKSLGESIEVI